MRELNYPEDKIASLRKFDHDLFVNKARRQQRKEQITADAFFIAIPTYDKKDINTFMDLDASIFIGQVKHLEFDLIRNQSH